METLSSLAEPDNELVSELLSERAEESDEVERGRDRDRDLRDDPLGYLGSSEISFELVSERERGVVERWDLLLTLEGELQGAESDDGKAGCDEEK